MECSQNDKNEKALIIIVIFSSYFYWKEHQKIDFSKKNINFLRLKVIYYLALYYSTDRVVIECFMREE